MMKSIAESAIIPAADWLRRLSAETKAFRVVSVAEHRPIGTGGMDWDVIVTLAPRSDKRRVKLFVETKSRLSPQTALAVFSRTALLPSDGYLMACSPYISPRVAELAREHNVNYLDAVGNCRIAVPGLFIEVSGRPNRPGPTKAVDPFATKSSRVVRTMLTEPERGWQVQQLSRSARVSIGLASKVKNALIEEAYAEDLNGLLYLRDPAKLLQDWAAEYRPRVKPVHLFSTARPPELEKRLAEWCQLNEVAYAITQLSAAWRYSPMVRYDRCVAFVDKKVAAETVIARLLRHLDARQVDTGANCTLWITAEDAVFTDTREIDGVTVASPIQLYLDLKGLPGRGDDAAQEILDKELPALRERSR